jgi:hypothetical protein
MAYQARHCPLISTHYSTFSYFVKTESQKPKNVKFFLVASPAFAAVATAGARFSVFPILDHAADDQRHDHCQYQ